ncbi:hypothetical protein SLUN_38845 (plasmid) [Streptomyces lunaelactis]|uniref:Uncharacterized protein n=1 Tax=Streptomyces lunaelactis TaxID=1535768 RepID=A0A2R4TFU4_9ACTN|nr:hypothetical protein [Streptomyces lunaelactis]AVZ77989.1 hypothetical protein SLUN_38845 [Streptomyces lunaelactis]NUK84936.1 hypothetical protein [Streptomyces lunaelactis]
MSDLHSNPDPGFAVATLIEALYALVSTHGPLPYRDIHGGDDADWLLLLRPGQDAADDDPGTVTVSVGTEFTHIEVTRHAEEPGEADTLGAFDGRAAYEVPLSSDLIRPLTRLVMDLVYTEEQSAPGPGRGVCQLCGGKGRALPIWRER